MLGNYHLFHVLLSLDYGFSVSKKAKLNTHTHTQHKKKIIKFNTKATHMYACMYEIEFKDEKLMQTDEQVHILVLQNWNEA